ncbi:hypothetical protein HETIRDRAFT_64973 [Heterobasidion irregulare TC 32-1]|uniref:MSP domain-containing protein n=1 Tax=Heterobasidion irregulare (strain TC 32-1) TaxID=747525 RepID=W4K9C0_HETIT|nr:uncharacterized protein HETIRDRAFT_64973 [Heterobasidion irregulare TC 32-1]ETW81681.1 hypothetical protein HETIRDRAFT_64973 [Heterobasidion irregulare TC 32-1]
MSVTLQPSNSLGFNRPLTQTVKRSLAITNPNAQPVAFKVKTTAPKLYCVRPNSGTVEPGETVEVQVMLQAMKEEPPLNVKCKDKFLIQSTLITPDKGASHDIWTVSEGEDPDKIKSQKIKVVYLPPDGQVVEEEDEGHANQPSMIIPGPSRYETVRGAPSVARPAESIMQRSLTPPADFSAAREDVHEEPVVVPESHSGNVGVVNVNVHTPQPPTPPAAPVPIPVPPVVDPNPQLLAKLKEMQSENQRLRALLAAVPDPSSVASSGTSPTELRRRHRPTSDDGTTTVESDVGTYYDDGALQAEGVPLQVVVIIALLIFITTYLFF